MLKKINIEDVKKLALQAGKVIMDIYDRDFKVEFKEDDSPLTEADTKSNEIICQTLEKLYPNIPIISEENQEVDFNKRKGWEYYWCIDPIDGTKEFIKRNGEFTVNIALIHKNTPVLGVVYAPAIKRLYWAKKDEGAFLNDERLPLKTNQTPDEKLYVVASKSHRSQQTQDFIDSIEAKEVELTSIGSSLKLCMVATGEADIYPRLAPTMEWDTAAADAIVREAGKMTYIFNTDEPVLYNKKELLNPWFIVK